MPDTKPQWGSDMNIGSVLSGALGLISLIYPSAGPVVAVVEKAAPYIDAALPVVQAAIKEGPGAFAAVKDAAPELADAIKQLAAHISVSPANLGGDADVVIENVTRALFGFKQMTPEQERAWMDSTTAWLSDSQAGSG